MSKESKVLIVYAIFLSTIPACLLISSKVTVLMGITFTVGGYAYAVTFPCTDIISECYGKKKARELVWLGFLGYILTWVFTLIAIKSPPADFWKANQVAFETTLGLVPRIAFGSVLAYLVAQLHDVWAFHFWRRVTKSRFLWLRNNFSTMTSQVIDTIVFVVVAFAGVVPAEVLWKMILGQYLLKLTIAVIDTPFVYLGVYWLREEHKFQSRKAKVGIKG